MILAYHQIVTQPCKYRYSITAPLFDGHMSAVATIETPPLVTFDDGHLSQFARGAPGLERNSLRGVYFITVGWVGRTHYMSWRKLEELHEQGHRIQSHGWSHKMLTECSRSELREELRRSKGILEDRLGVAVDAVSCPGGAWNRDVAEACADAGYKTLYTSDAWEPVRTEFGVDIVGRLMVRRDWTAEHLMDILRGDRKYAPSRMQFAVARLVRKTLGLRLYHSLWCWLADWSPETDAIR
jgi:peptidoglycan/xylan/chitin deacetylase (PgdA/CDA1 family)